MLKELSKLANKLDSAGETKIASDLDKIMDDYLEEYDLRAMNEYGLEPIEEPSVTELRAFDYESHEGDENKALQAALIGLTTDGADLSAGEKESLLNYISKLQAAADPEKSRGLIGIASHEITSIKK